MQTNPYAVTGSNKTLESYSASKIAVRIPGFVCVGSVSISVPFVTLWAIRIINSLVVSTMALWETILLFFSLVAAVPIGLASLMIARFACRGRWPLEIVVSALLLFGAFPMTYKLIAEIAFWKSSSLLGLYSSLIGSIAIVPMLIGVLLYSIVRITLCPAQELAINMVFDRRSDLT